MKLELTMQEVERLQTALFLAMQQSRQKGLALEWNSFDDLQKKIQLERIKR